jgi:glyoxylase-like metal-dependent hydrolase (beta-lactamase superfamily II)/rhodanese-related sulfurtransferase
MVEHVDCSHLNEVLGTYREPLVLDVRERDEVADWQIPGSVNIPLSELEERIDELPKGETILTVCASGRRSTAVAHILHEKGFKVQNLHGGMHKWACSYDTAIIARQGIEIIQVRRRGKGCLSYIVHSNGEAYVVDPASDISIYTDLAREKEIKITKVFDTHLHADHISGARKLAKSTGAKLYLNPLDIFHFEYNRLHDGDVFQLGDQVKFAVSAIHTPGHTQGSTVYFVGNDAILTGDTLFTDGVGRPDLAEKAHEFALNLYDSLITKVMVLSNDLIVLPAHYSTALKVLPGVPVSISLGELRRQLGILNLSKEDFVKWATSKISDRPANYQEIIKINMGVAEVDENLSLHLEIGPNRCSVA